MRAKPDCYVKYTQNTGWYCMVFAHSWRFRQPQKGMVGADNDHKQNVTARVFAQVGFRHDCFVIIFMQHDA